MYQLGVENLFVIQQRDAHVKASEHSLDVGLEYTEMSISGKHSPTMERLYVLETGTETMEARPNT